MLKSKIIIPLKDLNASVDKMGLPTFAKIKLKQLHYKMEGEIVSIEFAVANSNQGMFTFIVGVSKKEGNNASIGIYMGSVHSTLVQH